MLLCIHVFNYSECFETAVKLSPEEGFSKYMNLGQLLEGQEAVAAYNKGIQLMMANQCADQAQVYICLLLKSSSSTAVFKINPENDPKKFKSHFTNNI